jgi:hypothetical protein
MVLNPKALAYTWPCLRVQEPFVRHGHHCALKSHLSDCRVSGTSSSRLSFRLDLMWFARATDLSLDTRSIICSTQDFQYTPINLANLLP